MVAIAGGVKRCALCDEAKSLHEFYRDRRGVYSARCNRCHGLLRRTCTVCGSEFVGKSSRRSCSPECHRSLRPGTFRRCAHCGVLFGPLPRLDRKFCSMRCKIDSQKTGRQTFRKATAKARRAQALVRYQVLAGKMSRPTVWEECGASDKRIEAAHYDYDKPLMVRWLCRSCHVRWDKAEPKNGTVVIGPDFRSEMLQESRNVILPDYDNTQAA